MKICTKCKESKSLDNFNKNKARYDGRQTLCKECDRERARKKYLNSDGKYFDVLIANRNLRREKLQRNIIKYLEKHPCVDCGEKDLIVLQFDHLRDKVDNVCIMVANVRPWKVIENEILKCEIRCANCHIRKTSKQFNFYRSRLVSSNVEQESEELRVTGSSPVPATI